MKKDGHGSPHPETRVSVLQIGPNNRSGRLRSVAPLSDDALRALIRSDPARGWRSFIDQYTPLLLGLIRRGGLRDRDEVMEVYVLVCEQLSARGFERLKAQDGARGSIGGWLAVVTRHAIVDWVRSKKGRRRLFQAVEGLPALDRRVFELYYWDERSPSEIAEIVATETSARADLAGVLDALGRLNAALSDRHRAELLALAARAKAPVAIDDTGEAHRLPDATADPETAVRISQLHARFEAALTRLPPEDAAIVRLKFVAGLSNGDVERALGISGVTLARLQSILTALRAALEGLGVSGNDVAFGKHLSLDRSLS
jgi:DNA-directed RNA polymerase specialized sigma24 family protein